MNKEIMPLICEALREVLLAQDPQAKVQNDFTADTVIYDHSGGLDSLGLLSLVVAVEKKIREKFHVPVTLVTQKALVEGKAFRNVGSLTFYVEELLKKKVGSQ